MPALAPNHAGIGRPGRKPGRCRRFSLPRFAWRMSQPLLRLVGRRQAFQQTSIAVKRLGDILDIPQEPHTLAFRDGDHLPWLNKNLDLAFQPGRLPVLMGPRAAARRIIGVCPLLCWRSAA